jgi:erythromycin esterase
VVATPPTPSASSPAAPPDAPWPGLNLGFEEVSRGHPIRWGNTSTYEWASISDPRHGGERSLRLRSAGNAGLGVVCSSIPAAWVRGKRFIVHGWIKTDAVQGWAGIYLRVDGDTRAYADMKDHNVTGTVDWTEVAVDVEVPADAEYVVFGPVLSGEGTAWFDDLRFEVSDQLRSRPIVVEGTVVDASGKLVAGADVALVSDIGIQRHLRSDANGAFHFDSRSGLLAVSAHHAGEVGAFLERRQIDSDTRDIQLKLDARDGVVVHGTIGPGKPTAPAYVNIGILSPHEGDEFAVRVADDGTFEATLPRGIEYRAYLIEGGGGPASGKPTGDRVDIAITLPAPAPQEVVDWIHAHAIPLATAEPGHGLDDLDPIAKLIGNARVVALGEATRGTREFFQLTHRVLEYLVARQGFTAFAIEANQPECRAINNYVLYGTGDARTALKDIHVWTWNTEEVLAMIEWMRAWNADPRHPHKVQFLGFDMQTSKVAYANVAAFLNKVLPDTAPDLLAPIDVLGREDASAAIGRSTEEKQKRITEGLAAIAKAFETGHDVWARTATGAALDDVRHDLTILEQASEMYTARESSGLNVRGRSMATNIQWILGHQLPGTRMVVWAHNAHIANRIASPDNMGGDLRKQLKTAYLSVGFVFSQGSFQAIEHNEHSSLNEITLGIPSEFNASVAFARTGEPLLALDLRTLPQRGTVHDWFLTPHDVLETGAVFTTRSAMVAPQILPERYDAVIFVDQTTRARPLPRSK